MTIAKLIDRRLEQELLERRAANRLYQAQRRAALATTNAESHHLRRGRFRRAIVLRSAHRPDHNTGPGWNRGQRMMTPSPAEKSRRVVGLLRYITAPETNQSAGRASTEKCTYWRSTNFVLGETVEDHIDEMAAVAAANGRGGDPIVHIVLSFLPGEQPSPDQVDEAVRMVLAEAKFETCQAVWALHDDRDHVHIHIVVNRVDPISQKMMRWGGDSGRSYDVLGRAAARIDHAQGWTSAKNARFAIEGGKVVATRRVRVERAISQRAARYELEVGTPSAERTARSAVASIDLDQLTSWAEFHAAAERVGLRFEPRGNGLIVVVGAQTIKASQVGRVFSIERLESRFGPFESVATTSKAFETSPSTSADGKELVGSADEIPAPSIATSAYRDLLVRQAAERDALANRHRVERDEAYGPASGRRFVGAGGTLNALRAEIAARQKNELTALKEKHRVERKGLSAARATEPAAAAATGQPKRLRANSGDRSIEIAPSKVLRRTDRSFERRLDALKWFSVAVETDTVAVWCAGDIDDPGAKFFEDRGDRIRVPLTTDQEVLLAALTLAEYRGGSVRIHADTDLYGDVRDRIVPLAAAYDIALANPDLELQRRALMAIWARQNGRNLSVQNTFDAIRGGLGADSYALIAKRPNHLGGHGQAWSRDVLGVEFVPGYVARACVAMIRDADRVPFVEPRSGDRHYVLIDGMTDEQFRERSAQLASFSMVSAEANGTLSPVSAARRFDAPYAIQLDARNEIADRLNGVRPGSKNIERSCLIKVGDDPDRITRDKKGSFCARLQIEVEEAARRRANERAVAVKQRLAELREPSIVQTRLPSAAERENYRALAIYRAHARQIITSVCRHLDHAVVDRLIAERLRAGGFNPDRVTEILAIASPRVPTDRDAARKYLERTVAAAVPRTDIDRRRAEWRAPSWRRITDEALKQIEVEIERIRARQQIVIPQTPVVAPVVPNVAPPSSVGRPAVFPSAQPSAEVQPPRSPVPAASRLADVAGPARVSAEPARRDEVPESSPGPRDQSPAAMPRAPGPSPAAPAPIAARPADPRRVPDVDVMRPASSPIVRPPVTPTTRPSAEAWSQRGPGPALPQPDATAGPVRSPAVPAQEVKVPENSPEPRVAAPAAPVIPVSASSVAPVPRARPELDATTVMRPAPAELARPAAAEPPRVAELRRGGRIRQAVNWLFGGAPRPNATELQPNPAAMGRSPSSSDAKTSSGNGAAARGAPAAYGPATLVPRSAAAEPAVPSPRVEHSTPPPVQRGDHRGADAAALESRKSPLMPADEANDGAVRRLLARIRRDLADHQRQVELRQLFGSAKRAGDERAVVEHRAMWNGLLADRKRDLGDEHAQPQLWPTRPNPASDYQYRLIMSGTEDDYVSDEDRPAALRLARIIYYSPRTDPDPDRPVTYIQIPPGEILDAVRHEPDVVAYVALFERALADTGRLRSDLERTTTRERTGPSRSEQPSRAPMAPGVKPGPKRGRGIGD